jgi:hypothetical protein
MSEGITGVIRKLEMYQDQIKETPVTYEKKQVGKIKDAELDVEAGLVYADFELDEQTKKAILERD